MTEDNNVSNSGDNLEDIVSFSDEVSFIIYSEEEDNQFIRSTITIEQSEGKDGYEEIQTRHWIE